jgi:hypothetical protein
MRYANVFKSREQTGWFVVITDARDEGDRFGTALLPNWDEAIGAAVQWVEQNEDPTRE